MRSGVPLTQVAVRQSHAAVLAREHEWEKPYLLKWDAIILAEPRFFITRWKGSKSGVHCLQTDETEALEAPKS